MKIRTVSPNNRKKAFEITTPRATYEFPYSRLRLKPSTDDPVQEVFPDPEVGQNGFTYRLVSGQEDTVLMDQVLEYTKDSEYLRQALLFKLTLKAQERIRELGISRREVIRRMGTTPTQFYRLIDQKNAGKTLDQMLKLMVALDLQVDLIIGEAA